MQKAKEAGEVGGTGEDKQLPTTYSHYQPLLTTPSLLIKTI